MRHLRLLLLLLSPACAMAPAVELDARPGESKVLPTRDCGLHFLVDAFIDGAGPYALILDSGSSSTHLDPDLPVARGDTFSVGTLRIGPLVLRNHPVTASELDHIGRALGEPVHGILGWPAFAELLVAFDYPARTVSLVRGALPEPDGETVFACAATSGPYLNMDVGGETRTFLIDTGSNRGVAFSALDDSHFVTPPAVVSAVTVHEGVDLKRAGRLRHDLVFGKTVLERPVVDFTTQISIVGARVLRHFRITFDASRARMKLERHGGTGPIPSPPLRGLGIGFRAEPEGLRVIHVMAGGPGEAAGVRVGDVIVSLAGRDPRKRRCESLLREEDAERPLPLAVLREGQRIALTIEPAVLVR